MSSPIRVFAVRRADTGFVVEGPGGVDRPLCRADGEPLRTVGEDWDPRALVDGLGPSSLLVLRHADGGEAVWVLDGILRVRAHGLAELMPAELTMLREAVAHGMEPVFRFVLANEPVMDGEPALLSLGDAVLSDLARGSAPEPGPCEVLFPRRAPLPPQLGRDGRTHELDPHQLSALFGRTIAELAPAVLRDGALTLPSPVDGTPLRSDVGFPLSHFVFAFRFEDIRHGLPFVVVATMHVCRPAAVFFPLTGTTITRDHSDLSYLHHHHPGAPLGSCLRDHVATHAAAITRFLSCSSRRPALLLFHEHLGHHLWQELSGLDAIVPAMDEYGAPPVMVLNPSVTEMYGPVDALFPILSGRVERNFSSMPALAAEAYRRNLFLLAPTAAFIGRALAGRVLDHAEAAPEIANDRTLLGELRGRRSTVLLIGLRVENRTVVDFPGFALALAVLLREEVRGPLCLVLDGHSSRDGRPFDSHSHGRMREQPVAVEKRIVAAIRDRFGGTADTVVVDTVDAPMSRSLFWSRHCDGFVAPWGAGLAKYRWLGDRPGLVLAGTGYQDGGFDLHIYDSPEFTASRRPSLLIDRDGVEDVEDPDMLVPIDDPQRRNYRIDPAVLRRGVRRLLNALAAGRPDHDRPDGRPIEE